jgi:hypothetical protein
MSHLHRELPKLTLEHEIDQQDDHRERDARVNPRDHLPHPVKLSLSLIRHCRASPSS